MNYIILEILSNLKLVGFGLALFVVSYVTNMLFSTYYNISFLKEKFEVSRLKESAIKILMFVFGTTLLCIGITTIPIFADFAGIDLPTEYVSVFQDLAIVIVFVVMACRYFIEAYTKFKVILGYDKPSDEDVEEYKNNVKAIGFQAEQEKIDNFEEDEAEDEK